MIVHGKAALPLNITHSTTYHPPLAPAILLLWNASRQLPMAASLRALLAVLALHAIRFKNLLNATAHSLTAGPSPAASMRDGCATRQ